MEEINFEQQNERPKSLKVLCILSFISLGMSLYGVIGQFLSGPASKDQMLTQKAEMLKLIPQMEDANADYMVDMIKKVVSMLESLNNQTYLVSTVTLISLIIGTFGVIKMWKGSKIGFHFYIIYSLLGVCQLYLFVSPVYIPSLIVIWNLLISSIFIFLYSRNLYWMK